MKTITILSTFLLSFVAGATMADETYLPIAGGQIGQQQTVVTPGAITAAG